MDKNTRMGKWLAGLGAAALLGGLLSAPVTARADDPKEKPAAGKGKEKKPEIPIKIVDPIIVPDKSKPAKPPH